ncbi:hypothetical protein K493DRAFT_336545 [Basidiobolus meristosporus CBS 931.73]|uniref:Uncharacterized protein n=1 Tax=Basidiobolus meristosporus CBS 931.73 TaxID=1314790 RepID=A0A1Y1YHH2_9FUNG|nr:hypothetical protein K493DRAFT_336545 [Basidiobolus meristosporus CBS 931.73]|eukprot:ORX97490.1 hypothetical protein K493DRAFT_336545 [Basidiobolus meristosporus CBS 931.73]
MSGIVKRGYQDLLDKLPVALREINYKGGKIRAWYGCGLAVDIEDIIKKYQGNRGDDWLFAFADTVRLPKLLPKDTQRNLFIFARKIECREGNTSEIHLFSISEWLGIFASQGGCKIRLVGNTMRGATLSQDVQEHEITEGSLFRWYRYENPNDPAGRFDRNPDGEVYPSPDFMETFGVDVACQYHAEQVSKIALYTLYDDPDLAASIIDYVRDLLVKYDSSDSELWVRIKSIETALKVNYKDASMVSVLRKEIYLDVVEAFATSIDSYEAQCDRYADRSVDLSERRRVADLMVSNIDASLEFNGSTLAQASLDKDRAQRALQEAIAVVQGIETESAIARNNFEAGLEAWREQQERQAIWAVVTGVVEFVGSVALMCVGDVAAAGGAAKAAANVVSAAEKVAEMVEVIQKVAETIQKLYDLMDKINQLTNIQNSYESALGAGQDIDELAAKLRDVDFSKYDAALSKADWDAFTLSVDHMLTEVIAEGVSGAAEYQMVLKKFAIYGKAVVDAQVASCEAIEEFVRISLERVMVEKQKANFVEYLKELGDDIEAYNQLSIKFYDLSLTQKFWFNYHLAKYIQAFRYWALRESAIQMSMLKRGADYRQLLAVLKAEYASALETLYPGPQPFKYRFNIPGDIDLFPGLVEDFNANRQITITFPNTSTEFMGMQRVRIDTISVFLEGADAGGKSIYLTVKSTGSYGDSLQNNNFLFQTVPFSGVFSYRSEDEIEIRINTLSTENAYLQPTPFAPWTISAPADRNPKLGSLWDDFYEGDLRRFVDPPCEILVQYDRLRLLGRSSTRYSAI